ncbi:hypothetical protein CHLRE_06g274700v5 [Chlamydomonas reinhardtii]|uniref:Ubiquitin thioesterase OTU n=1 Tax=Chlamydomonas reinhardtii TaxID=3055 RepID=A0A2K3DNK4_CHLRE|nr:uncharacterized protein CHLRE_06g274700v5 [Chlamydomonas reinhardtii]PNW82117.1 hypothetical protein CHLRE_06g274700v5 [Chlamydomonas reinhardtii]
MTSSPALSEAPAAPKAVRPSSASGTSTKAAGASTKTKKTTSKTAAAAAPPAKPSRATSAAGLPLPALVAGGVGALGLVALAAWALVSGRRRGGSSSSSKDGKDGGKDSAVKGPCSKLKPTSRCVPLADGSGCVVRREIPADNSCLFNSIGYVMHRSKTRAPHLRNVVAQQVSGDRNTYSDAFLGMSNESYCAWIRQPYNWGGGIELAILAQAYGIEIAAWNIESKKEHVFGEESGYKRQVMVIYNGVHYDALAVCAHPRANADEDELNYNPRGKRGKMIIAAARKLVELAHKESAFNGAAEKKAAAAAAAAAKKAAAAAAKTNGTTAASTGAGSGASSATANSTSGSSSNGGSGTAGGAKTASGAKSSKPRVARSAAAASTAAGAAKADGAPTAASGSGAGAGAVGAGLSGGTKLSCGDCGVMLDGPAAAQQHAHSTGHVNFSEVAAA